MATKGRAGGKKTGGRKAGVPNKVTASMRQAWQDAFDSLGGVPALVKWGRAEPTEFYKLAAKLIPLDITSGGKELAGLTWTFGDRKVEF
jgi:hypothetical protein